MAVSYIEPLAPQGYTVANVGGITTAVNTVSTAGGQVIGTDSQRKSITFANPNIVGNVTLLVYQMVDINNNPLAPTFAAPGGGFPLLPGGVVTFTGDIQGAWGAVAQSGPTNGLTIISSRS